MDKYSYLGNADPSMIEELFKQYKADPSSVDESWGKFFEGFEFSQLHYGEGGTDPNTDYPSEFKVINLINGYRTRGHLFTKTNPVRTRRQYRPTLELENFGLTQSDLERKFAAGNEIGIGEAYLKEIIDHLEHTYCKSVGVEYMFIRNVEVQSWLRASMERTKNTMPFTKEDKIYILKRNLFPVF